MGIGNGPLLDGRTRQCSQNIRQWISRRIVHTLLHTLVPHSSIAEVYWRGRERCIQQPLQAGDQSGGSHHVECGTVGGGAVYGPECARRFRKQASSPVERTHRANSGGGEPCGSAVYGGNPDYHPGWAPG